MKLNNPFNTNQTLFLTFSLYILTVVLMTSIVVSCVLHPIPTIPILVIIASVRVIYAVIKGK